MKLLLISDIHMSNKLPHARPSRLGMTDRLEDQIALWKHVAEEARECDGVFILGDLLDKSLVDAVTMTATTEALISIDKDVWVLSGNHDAATLRGERYMCEVFGVMGAERVHYFEHGMPLPLGGVVFWPLHFVTADAFRSEMVAVRQAISDIGDGHGPHVLLFHQSVLDCWHLGWKCDDGLAPHEVCDGFVRAYAGHFHEHQRFGDCGMYLGAPMHHSFADEGRVPGFWILDTESMEERFVETLQPRFHRLDAVKSKLPEGLRQGDFLRYEIRATHDDWTRLRPAVIERVERLCRAGIKASFKHKPIVASGARLDLAEGHKVVSLDDQVGAYVRHVSGADNAALAALGREILGEARGVD